MTWLRDHQLLNLQEDESTADESEPAWVREHHMSMLKEKRLRKYKDLQARIEKVRELERKEKLSVLQNGRMFGTNIGSGLSKRSKTGEKEEGTDVKYVVEDYYSDAEDGPTSVNKNDPDNNLSGEVQALLRKYESL